MKQPMTLVFLGDIAAGKGTQAKILAQKFGLGLIDVGEYSRKLWHSGKMARVKSGRLAPTDIIQNYLRSKILNLKPREGVLIDGGKMPAEARLINKIFEAQGRKFLVIYLRIPNSEIYKRLKVRLKQESRADDSPQALRNRMDYYKKIYTKTVEFWKRKGVLRKVNGRGRVKRVNSRIIRVIRAYFSKSLRGSA